jgi:hypothetical protein
MCSVRGLIGVRIDSRARVRTLPGGPGVIDGIAFADIADEADASYCFCAAALAARTGRGCTADINRFVNIGGSARLAEPRRPPLLACELL